MVLDGSTCQGVWKCDGRSMSEYAQSVFIWEFEGLYMNGSGFTYKLIVYFSFRNIV